jgi:hypothetical protein
MNQARLRVVVVLLIPVIIIGEFILDVLTPQGIADWALYVIPLLLSVYVGNSRLTYPLAAILTVLTLVAFFLSPPGIDPEWALIGSLVGIAVLWLMALLIRLAFSFEQATKARQSPRFLSTIGAG